MSKRLYWRPKRISRSALLFVGILSVVGVVAVEHLRVESRQPDFDLKIQAATLAEQCMEAIKSERLARGHAIDFELDPAGSGMIGALMSSVTSVSGELAAKQTTVNPNFAAVVVDMLRKGGVRAGDVVAVGYSGSFPALNICVSSALEAMGARPVIISSATASQFGANLPDLLWIDMERLLVEKGLLHHRSTAGSLGGYEDLGLGLSIESRELLKEALDRNGLKLLQAESFTEGIDKRMAVYRTNAGRAPIKAYVNVGGGAVSVGRSIGKRLYQPGLNLRPPRGALNVDSVMTRMMREGCPALHLVQVREIAEKYGLPNAPTETPAVGEGGVFFQEVYNRWLAVVLLAAIFGGLYAFVLSDVGLRILKGAARQHESVYPQAAV